MTLGEPPFADRLIVISFWSQASFKEQLLYNFSQKVQSAIHCTNNCFHKAGLFEWRINKGKLIYLVRWKWDANFISWEEKTFVYTMTQIWCKWFCWFFSSNYIFPHISLQWIGIFPLFPACSYTSWMFSYETSMLHMRQRNGCWMFLRTMLDSSLL